MPLRVVTFRLDDRAVDRLRTAAAVRGVPVSEIIRRALEEYLVRLESSDEVLRVRRVVLA